MSKKYPLILIPNYVGSFERKVDDKLRVNLPAIIRRTMRERNRFNLISKDYDVVRDFNDDYALAFKGVPFAAPIPNHAVAKKDLDITSLDNIVYIATGRIEGVKPEFMSTDADTVFIYSTTDAQRVLYDKAWKGSGFTSNHRITKIDRNGRIKLNEVEHAICVNTGHLQFPTRESTEQDIYQPFTIISGHPSLFCATLTKEYQPTL